MARGTDIASRLPAHHTVVREQMIYDAVSAAQIVPMKWKELPVSHRFSDGSMISGIIRVAERALRLGEHGDSFLPNVNHVTAQRIADALAKVPAADAKAGVVLPTSKIVDVAFEQSDFVIDPCIRTPDAHMRDTDRMLEHSRCVDQGIAGRCGAPSTEGKAWCNTTRLRGRPRLAANYGLFASGARYRSVRGHQLWQPGPGTRHISGFRSPGAPEGYTDYVQVLEKLVRVDMHVDGEGEMDIRDVARHPVYCWLISAEGPLKLRHPAVPDPDATVEPEPPAPPARPPLLSRTLRIGMTGQDVGFVQRLVGAKADLIFGPKTAAAVKRWQAQHVDTSGRPLAVDGIVGLRTRAAMLSAIGPAPPTTAPDAFEPGSWDPSQAEYVEARYYNRHVLRDTVHWLVLHSAEGAEIPTFAEALARYFSTMPDGRVASAHWNFDDDSGTISVPEERIAYHAKKANRYGVGYEHAGYARQSRAEWLDDYSESMLYLSAMTAARVTLPRWEIPADNWVDADGLKEAYTYINAGKKVPDRLRGITTHEDVTLGLGGTHRDPGKGFPKDVYTRFIAEAA